MASYINITPNGWVYGNIDIIPKCPYCHNYHEIERCPRIKSISYHPNGTIARIEFFEIEKQTITAEDLMRALG